MTDASLCGLGQTAASAVLSAMKLWPGMFKDGGGAKVESRKLKVAGAKKDKTEGVKRAAKPKTVKKAAVKKPKTVKKSVAKPKKAKKSTKR
jgi:hypothetical protein